MAPCISSRGEALPLTGIRTRWSTIIYSASVERCIVKPGGSPSFSRRTVDARLDHGTEYRLLCQERWLDRFFSLFPSSSHPPVRDQCSVPNVFLPNAPALVTDLLPFTPFRSCSRRQWLTQHASELSDYKTNRNGSRPSYPAHTWKW